MYDVFITNEGIEQLIHYHAAAAGTEKLASGQIVDAVNSISSFTFTIYPNNSGYDVLLPYTTQIRVYNSRKKKDVFVGRVLQVTPSMDQDGRVSKSVVCEDRFGYLHDSIQPYTETRHYVGDDTRTGLEEFIDLLLDRHNATVEPYKHIHRGIVTVSPFESSDGVTKGLNWESTWECLTKKLLESFGGFFILREADGTLYLDYVAEAGTTRATKIELARNMVSGTKEIDPSGIVTHLVPLGAKIKTVDETGTETETEQRLTIESVNDGKDYIVSSDYRERYGVRYRTVVYDNVTTASALLRKGTEYLSENNGLAISHNITALELSSIGLDIDDFVVYDRYPVWNPLIGVDDILQIIKKTTNIITQYNSSFEMGDLFKRLSDTVVDYNAMISNVRSDIAVANTNVKNQVEGVTAYVNTSISTAIQDPDVIWAAIQDKATAKSEYETFTETIRNILQMEADGTTFIFQTIAETIAQVEGIEATHYAELLTHIRFNANGIEIGKEGAAITARWTNDRLEFSNNGMVVAYISDNSLFITDGRFLNSVRIGNYGFVHETNDSVSFTYMGGGES